MWPPCAAGRLASPAAPVTLMSGPETARDNRTRREPGGGGGDAPQLRPGITPPRRRGLGGARLAGQARADAGRRTGAPCPCDQTTPETDPTAAFVHMMDRADSEPVSARNNATKAALRGAVRRRAARRCAVAAGLRDAQLCLARCRVSPTR